MKRAAMAVMGLIAVMLAACGSDEPTPNPDDPQYKLGYDAGHADGVAEVCDQISDYKDSMAEALQGAGICPN